MTTALLPFTRECDHPKCTNTFRPTGDGSTPFLSTRDGGVYFCSETCRRTFVPRQATLVELLTDAFAAANIPSPGEVAASFISAFSPKVSELSGGINPCGQTYRQFKIQNHPTASLISCVLSGDKNFQAHVGRDGVAHTLPRIGDFALVISEVEPDALLREIRQVKFTRTIPLGAAVIITATKTSERRGRTEYLVAGHLEDGQPVCPPTQVVTFQSSVS